MEQTGIVTKIVSTQMAEVQVMRQTACGHSCDNCGECMITNRTITALAENQIGANVGDRVIVESSSQQILSWAALLYLTPVVLLVLVYALLSTFSEGLRILISSLFFVGGFALVGIYSRKRLTQKRQVFRIVAFENKE